MQPFERDRDGIMRFKPNAIVRFMLDAGRNGWKFDLNVLAAMDFSDDDRMQLAQLIGYSLSGYGELPYVSNESYEAAEEALRIAEALAAVPASPNEEKTFSLPGTPGRGDSLEPAPRRKVKPQTPVEVLTDFVQILREQRAPADLVAIAERVLLTEQARGGSCACPPTSRCPIHQEYR
jgi:hypothetical protein